MFIGYTGMLAGPQPAPLWPALASSLHFSRPVQAEDGTGSQKPLAAMQLGVLTNKYTEQSSFAVTISLVSFKKCGYHFCSNCIVLTKKASTGGSKGVVLIFFIANMHTVRSLYRIHSGKVHLSSDEFGPGSNTKARRPTPKPFSLPEKARLL